MYPQDSKHSLKFILSLLICFSLPVLSVFWLVLKKIHGSKMSSYFLSTNELDKISMIFLKIFLLSVRNTEFSKGHQGTINAAIY